MDPVIRTFVKGTEEFEKLEIVAMMLTNRSPNHWGYYVGETYFDFGQNWKWATILCNGGGYGGYQALNPHRQEAILFAETYDEFVEIVKEIFAGKFCPDKQEDKPYDGSFSKESLPYLGW